MRLMIILALAFCAAPLHADGLGWRIAGADGGTAYLVGTIHAARESMYPLPEPINEAFARSDVLVVEVDTGRRNTANQARAVIAQEGMLPDGVSLQNLVAPETWARIVEWAQRHGMSQLDLMEVRPWLAAIRLVSLEIQRLGLDPELGVERHLTTRARTRGMRIVELESVSQQLSTLAALPPATQVAFLEGSIPDGDGFEASVERVVASWRDGDLDAMTAVLEETYTEPALYDALMRRRNHEWLPEIERMVASGSVHFVAVGALHLVGADGLVRLLEQRGYRLERL